MTTDSGPPKAAQARGDFYLQERCCTSCGVPQMIAPELVGWTDEEHASCYWIRQPEMAAELDRAIEIIHTQELGCHRYAGKDPAILERLPREECDFLCPEMALRHSPVFGPSDVPLRLSLFVSQEGDGFLKRIWRKIMRHGSRP